MPFLLPSTWNTMAMKSAIFFMMFYAFTISCSEQQNNEPKRSLIKAYTLTYGGHALTLSGIALGLKSTKNIIWPQQSLFSMIINKKKVYWLALSKNSTLINQVSNSADYLLAAALIGAGRYLTKRAQK